MSASDIVTMVTNLGFPIIAYVFLFRYVQKREDTHDTERAEERREHKAEMEKITEAVNGLTLIMQKLIDKLNEGGC